MKSTQEIKDQVKEKYSEIARNGSEGCEPASGCCGTDIPIAMIGDEYESLEGYVADADLKLGCGLPTESAGISEGDIVIDLGSGAGNDAFIARTIVKESGKVIGVDFSDDMLALARKNALKLKFNNVDFVKGEIENIPLPDSIADVVVSNCVMNLVPNKAKAFSETFRLLKAGGHFSISDIVYTGDMPQELREVADLYTGCVSGAVAKEEYLKTIEEAGFTAVTIPITKKIEFSQEELDTHLSKELQGRLSEFTIESITVNATKPATLVDVSDTQVSDEEACVPGSGCC